MHKQITSRCSCDIAPEYEMSMGHMGRAYDNQKSRAQIKTWLIPTIKQQYKLQEPKDDCGTELPEVDLVPTCSRRGFPEVPDKEGKSAYTGRSGWRTDVRKQPQTARKHKLVRSGLAVT